MLNCSVNPLQLHKFLFTTA